MLYGASPPGSHCYRKGFLSLASYSFLSCKVGVHHHQLGVGHSWQDYIYSPATLYGVCLPFAIKQITSVLAFQPSPILPDFKGPIPVI